MEIGCNKIDSKEIKNIKSLVHGNNLVPDVDLIQTRNDTCHLYMSAENNYGIVDLFIEKNWDKAQKRAEKYLSNLLKSLKITLNKKELD